MKLVHRFTNLTVSISLKYVTMYTLHNIRHFPPYFCLTYVRDLVKRESLVSQTRVSLSSLIIIRGVHSNCCFFEIQLAAIGSPSNVR